jgi:hypothetical protein
MNYKGQPINHFEDKQKYNFGEYSPEAKQLLEHFP